MKTERASRKITRFIPSARGGSWVTVSLIVASPTNATSLLVGSSGFYLPWKARLVKRRKFHQIVLRDRFQRFAGLAPGSESADNHERVESFFPQQMRHPGAGRFARSSTVKVNVLVFGKVLDLFLKIVGFDADRAFNSSSPGVVVAVAAHVDDQHAAGILRRQARGQFLYLNPRHH